MNEHELTMTKIIFMYYKILNTFLKIHCYFIIPNILIVTQFIYLYYEAQCG